MPAMMQCSQPEPVPPDAEESQSTWCSAATKLHWLWELRREARGKQPEAEGRGQSQQDGRNARLWHVVSSRLVSSCLVARVVEPKGNERGTRGSAGRVE